MACAKCGKDPVVEDVHILDRGRYDEENELAAAVYRGKGDGMKSAVVGRMCGSCGYLELYVTDPAALVEVARDR